MKKKFKVECPMCGMMFIFYLFRGTLDLNLKHAATEKKSNHDIHARKIREKERDLK